MDETQEAVEGLLYQYAFTKCIINSSLLEWSDKYDVIFSSKCSSAVVRLFSELGLSFNYHDPDSGYEDDCRAFFNYFTERLKVVNAIKAALDNVEATK